MAIICSQQQQHTPTHSGRCRCWRLPADWSNRPRNNATFNERPTTQGANQNLTFMSNWTSGGHFT